MRKIEMKNQFVKVVKNGNKFLVVYKDGKIHSTWKTEKHAVLMQKILNALYSGAERCH